MANLEEYIATVHSNIETFNQHVRVNLEGSKVRGERTDDIMTTLLKAHNVNLDTEFVG